MAISDTNALQNSICIKTMKILIENLNIEHLQSSGIYNYILQNGVSERQLTL